MIEVICRQCGRIETVKSLQVECDYCHGPDTLEVLVWPENSRSGLRETATSPAPAGSGSQRKSFAASSGGWPRKRSVRRQLNKLLFALCLGLMVSGCATSRQVEVEAMTPNAVSSRPEVAVAVRVTTNFR